MKLQPNAALVILSGGQDSTTCLFYALERYESVYAVTFDYGQRHARELQAAEDVYNIAAKYHPDKLKAHEFVGLGKVLRGTSPLVSSEKLEEYKDADSLPGGLEKTFVPGRNLLFLTLAANTAYSYGITNVVIGVSQEDFGGYPDCRGDFIGAAERAIAYGMSYRDPETGKRDEFAEFGIDTPLLNKSKAETVNLARQFPGCWEAMAYTHTAYDGRYPPTGHDHASLLRAKGFEEAGFPDPLVVRAWREGLMDLPRTPNYEGVRNEA